MTEPFNKISQHNSLGLLISQFPSSSHVNDSEFTDCDATTRRRKRSLEDDQHNQLKTQTIEPGTWSFPHIRISSFPRAQQPRQPDEHHHPLCKDCRKIDFDAIFKVFKGKEATKSHLWPVPRIFDFRLRLLCKKLVNNMQTRVRDFAKFGNWHLVAYSAARYFETKLS